MVETGELNTCLEQKLLVTLVKNKFKENTIIVKHEKIEDGILLIEKYMNFKLFPWEKFLFACTYGLYYEDGTLVFDEYFILIGRGAGKNGYLDGTTLYETTKKFGIKKYHIELIATSEDQAKISFNDIYDVIDDNHILKEKYDYTKTVIRNKSTKTEVHYNTSSAKTKDGKRPGHVKFDEVHAMEDFEKIKVFISALGKVEEPRITYITTQGNVRGAVLDELISVSEDILKGKITNSRMLPFICKLDSEEEVDNPKNWEKANPSLPYLPNLKNQMLSEYEKAKLRPELWQEFLIKRMNIPKVDEAKCVTSWENILATNQKLPDIPNGIDAIGGIDYAELRDFCGCGILFKYNGKYFFKHHSFICGKSSYLKYIKFNYEEAERQGLCTIVKEETIRPIHIINWFIEQSKQFNILKIALDNFRFSTLRDEFEKHHLYCETKDRPTGMIKLIRNGSYTHNQIAPLIDDLFCNKRIVFGNDMMMRWYTNNTYCKKDDKGNKTYGKIEKETRKNDGFMAFVHAMSLEALLKEKKTIKHINSISL